MKTKRAYFEDGEVIETTRACTLRRAVSHKLHYDYPYFKKYGMKCRVWYKDPPSDWYKVYNDFWRRLDAAVDTERLAKQLERDMIQFEKEHKKL